MDMSLYPFRCCPGIFGTEPKAVLGNPYFFKKMSCFILEIHMNVALYSMYIGVYLNLKLVAFYLQNL